VSDELREPRPLTVRATRTLAHLARVLERASGELSLPQYRILSLVARGDERASVLAGRLALTKPTVSAIVDNLAERGLLERRAVEGDRRSIQLVVTPRGTAALDCVERSMAGELERLLQRVDDRDALLHGLSQLDDVIRSERKERIDARLAADHEATR
jgi:DNA-binding MarR family transcriptional regulator